MDEKNLPKEVKKITPPKEVKKLDSPEEVKKLNSPKIVKKLESGEEDVSQSKSPKSQKSFNFKFWSKKKKDSSEKTGKKKIGTKSKIALFIILLIIIPIAASAYPIYQLANLGKTTKTTADELMAAAKGQDLALASEKLNSFHSDLQGVSKTYKLLSWMQYSPFRWHYQDGQRVISSSIAGVEAGQEFLGAVMPYADVLGLKGEGTFTGGTTEERIVAILDTLDKISPSLDKVSEKLVFARDQIGQIDTSRYPDSIADQSPAELIATANEYLNMAVDGVENAKPIIKVLPKLAGVDETKRYLVLFQNDAELRPTGGFMTAYTIMDITRGTIVAERSVNIYDLDAKFNKRLEPPEAIQKYFDNVYYWYLRDMNLSPDFKDSMDTFISYYESIPGEPEVNGIIAIDTNVLKDLVDVLGPIDVPGFGTFTSEIVPQCDCPQVIYQLEDMITRPVNYERESRKAVLGPMMQVLLKKAFDADSNAWPQLFESMFDNVSQKHILFYMKNEEMQEAAEKINVAGRIKDFDGDYLHINDANFGGAKSNMFVTQKVEQEVEVKSDSVYKKITISYKNPFPGSNCNLEAGGLCLNGILKDYMRVYLPAGAELVNSMGFEEDTVKTYEEFGKTAIEGLFLLQPQSQTKLVLEVSVPYVPGEEYKMMIQKQPGTYSPEHTLTIGESVYEEFSLETDKTLEIEL